MVPNHTGQLFWLTNIRNWKIVLMETILASANTIKNTKCYRNIIYQDEKRQNQPRTNEQRVLLQFLVISFWDYKLQFQINLGHLCFKRNKTVQNNPWKIMLWHIPSTNQEKSVTFSRPKGSLLTGINKLKTTQGRESFLERHTYV